MSILRLLPFLLLLSTLPLRAAMPGAETLAQLITTQFDTDSDRILDEDEWTAGLENGFQEMDGNHDGSLTGAEIDALAGPIGKETGDIPARIVTVLIKKLVLVMDSAKDGAVSREEYTTQAGALFQKLDTTRNGTVEQAELLELPRRLLGV